MDVAETTVFDYIMLAREMIIYKNNSNNNNNKKNSYPT